MINRIESDTLEFKSEIVSDICKEIIAFANTRGGELLIGVADDGTVTGLSDADDILLQIKNMVRDSIKPDLTMLRSPYDRRKRNRLCHDPKRHGSPVLSCSKGPETKRRLRAPWVFQ